MALIFPRWTNYLPLVLAAVAPVGGLVVAVAGWYYLSPRFTDVGYRPPQPVAFSHALHAGDLGIDCRYCHSTVEEAAHAAIPATSTCMNCHALVKQDSEKLELVRESHETGEPIPWLNVHLLPDYAFFHHDVHVAAGVGCVECHGRIDEMEVVEQAEPLSMGWCLKCHWDPWEQLRPPQEVTNMAWNADDVGYDARLDPTRRREPEPPTHCSGCHR